MADLRTLHVTAAPTALQRTAFFALLFRMACALALFVGLCDLYVSYVSVAFAYYGFAYDFIPTRLPLALAAIVLLTAFLRPHIREISELTATLSHLFFLIPTAAMYVYGGIFGSIFLWTVIIQALVILVSRLELRLALRTSIPLGILEISLLGLALVGLAIVAIQYGVFSLNFNINEIYERRAEANDADLGILGYVAQFGAQAALLLIAVAFYNRNLPMTGLGLAMTLLYFGYTGHKSMVFWAVFVVLLIYAGRFKSKFLYLVGVSTGFVWLVAWSINTDIGTQLANYLIRRTLFTPVLLNHYYMLFADQFGFLDWSYSKVGLGLFEYSDTVSPTEAVGYYLTGNEQNSANTGMIGFGFLNAGHAGVAVYLAVFLAILAASSALSREKGIEMLGAAIMVRATYFAITTSDLPSAVLSGGLGYSLLLLVIYPRAEREPRRRSDASVARSPRLVGTSVGSGFPVKPMPWQENR
jgi:hypothetical protein